MTIRLYETKMEFDYDSSDGTVKTTHIVYIESDGLYFNGTIRGTGSPGVFIDSTVSSDSSGLSTGDFEFQHNQIAFGSNTLFAKADGSGVVFSGTLGTTLDSFEAPPAQGTASGFSSGGNNPALSPSVTNIIDKFPFSILNGTATDVGDLRNVTREAMGHSSSTDGFASAGYAPSTTSEIQKFPFAISSGTAIDAGDLTIARVSGGGISSTTDGFTSGGNSSLYGTLIEKFPFAISGGTATDVGDLSEAKYGFGAHESKTHGFASGGFKSPPHPATPPLRISNIEKFPFSISSGTATDIGDLNTARNWCEGLSSITDGFIAGGSRDTPPPATQLSDIEKFSFASGGTASDVGDLTQTNSLFNGSSTSREDGFTLGGYDFAGSPAAQSLINKFPFSISASGAAVDIGDLSAERSRGTGHQD